MKKEKGGGRMKSSWIFLILAIFCAIYAENIDRALKGNQQVKKVVLVTAAGTFLVSLIAVAASLFS